MTTFRSVTFADWRAQVEKELAGKPFDKVLVEESIEGLSIAPLYVEAPKVARDLGAGRFRICVRASSVDEVDEDLAGGADGAWLPLDAALESAELFVKHANASFVLEPGAISARDAVDRVVAARRGGGSASFLLACDPFARHARAPSDLSAELAGLGLAAKRLAAEAPGASVALVSTLPYHDAGADAAFELALALSGGARILDALLASGLSLEEAAGQIAFQVAVGRDTFLELCKLRALRVCWGKVLGAAGLAVPRRPTVHAVCSSRTLSVRDPWVNMLRATTQVFAAVLGGADLVTPSTFDQTSGKPSPLARRVARNTGLVLREESFLGKVVDPAGGSYYLDTLTDALSREAWDRFRALEKEGGIGAALTSGVLREKLEATWRARLVPIMKRKTAILGVSEFANLDERVPFAPAAPSSDSSGPALIAHRDAEVFEALRSQAEAKTPSPEALLVTLGSLAESRPRAGFASGLFAAGGIRTRETIADEKAAIVCICGTDERYATEAASRARALKAAGAGRVLVAGRPGALEAELREAGVDGFIYVGCDVAATLSELLDEAS